MSKFGRISKRRKLRVNVGTSKVVRSGMHAILNGKPLEEVDCFKYLESQVAADAGHDWDVMHRMNEGYRVYGVLKTVMSNRGLMIKTKKHLYEGVIVPMALYGSETWGMRSADIRKVYVLEMKCLRSLVKCQEWIELGMKRCVG